MAWCLCVFYADEEVSGMMEINIFIEDIYTWIIFVMIERAFISIL